VHKYLCQAYCGSQSVYLTVHAPDFDSAFTAAELRLKESGHRDAMVFCVQLAFDHPDEA
jgi:hypothetical protein